jgi:hypothetical protein
MIILLYGLSGSKERKAARAIKTTHVEFFHNRVEFLQDESTTHIDIVGPNHDFVWGEQYDYCLVYDNDDEYVIRDAYPKCKWEGL